MELTKIKTMIERALADGRLSHAESEDIKSAIYSDRKVSREECELFRHLQQKVWKGEIILED